MKDQTIDARGLSCPEPLLLSKRAIKAAGSGRIVILVDNETAVENVSRVARADGWAVALEETGSDTRMTMTKG